MLGDTSVEMFKLGLSYTVVKIPRLTWRVNCETTVQCWTYYFVFSMKSILS